MANAKYSEAILEYRNALKADGRFGEARYKLAQALEKAGRPDAVKEYLRAAELLPDRVELQLKAGSILLSAREFERARQAGEAALKADPKNVEAQLLIAHSHAAAKDLPSAVREIEEAIQLAPDDSRPYTSLGTVRLAEGDRKKAAAAYRRALELDPKSITARLALAVFHWSGNARSEAEAELKEAIAIDSKSILANRLQALFYLTGGRPDEAEAPLLRLAESADPPAILTVADHYARTKRIAEARSMYERLRADKRTRTTAVLRLATLEYANGNREQAHAALDEELKAEVPDAEVATLKAKLLLVEGKLPQAEDYAKKAVTADSSSAAAHYVLGLTQMGRGERDAAARSFNETLRINPKAGAAELQLSRLSLAAGNTDEALRRAESARRTLPGGLGGRLEVARALVARGDYDKAQAELKALRLDYPNAPGVHALYGVLLMARSDEAGAGRELDRALELDPTHLQALSARVTFDLRRKQPAAARARVAKALAARPDSSPLLALAGRLEATLGDMAAAERYLRRAIEVNPSAFDAYPALAQVYVRQKRLDEARVEYEKLAALSADSVAAKTMVAMIYETQNRRADALRVYEEIVAKTNRAPVAANNLAWYYAESGEKLDMALQLAQSAKQQLPDSHAVDDTLGWVYYRRNMADLAIPVLQRAVKADAQNPQYHAHLGLAYAKAGRPGDARQSLERALALRPNFPGADEARSTLASLGR